MSIEDLREIVRERFNDAEESTQKGLLLLANVGDVIEIMREMVIEAYAKGREDEVARKKMPSRVQRYFGLE